MDEDRVYLCTSCHWEKVPYKRWQLGVKRKDPSYFTCLPCGQQQAELARKSWCVATLHKSNSILVTNRADLIGINNKGGLVR